LSGYDYIRGGQGNDNITGNSGNDIVNGNFGNDVGRGGGGNDIVRGGRGDDALFGDDGDDVLIGDLGKDELTGGAGADGFFLRSDDLAADASGADRILDFTSGVDYILANGISRSQITFSNVAVGGTAGLNDTAILFGGQVLGVVIDTNSADVFSRFFNVGSSPSVLGIG